MILARSQLIRKNESLYSVGIKKHAAPLEKLGKHKTGVGCLYINKLDDIDIDVPLPLRF